MPWIAVAAVLAIVAAGLGIVAYRATRPQEKSAVRLDIDLGPDRTVRPRITDRMWSSRRMARGWPICRKIASSPGGSINPKARNSPGPKEP